MIAGIWADKFDQLAGFQNFLIMPLTMLSGVFYSIHSLPPFWQHGVAFQPVLLHDRRLPLRLLRCLRHGALDSASPSVAVPSPLRWRPWPAAQRLQIAVLNHDARKKQVER
jgi:ABC-type polysaccharide/polyol phosphate export permease